jgi:predicted MPP superfamily phosphohydrolase
MVLAVPLFLAIVILLWCALHVYVSWRVLSPLPIPRWFRTFLYVCWLPLMACVPASFALDSPQPSPYDLAFRWLVWTYFGVFSVLFALLGARDLAFLVLRGVEKMRREHPPMAAERRRFLYNVTTGAAVMATGVLSYLGVRSARRLPEIANVEIKIAGLPHEFDGYHIVQLSDVHVGLTIDKEFILPIVEAVTSLKPDLIALTGDLVDGKVDRLRDDISPFGYLRAPDGILCVTGNHEYYSGVEEWCQHYRELGITVLNNQHVSVARGAKKLVIAGITDRREGKKFPGHTPDAKAALEGAPQHDVRILLAHQPKAVRDVQEHGFALQLSGHTHGGQYFPWNLFVGLVEPFDTGLTRVGKGWLYVSRGTCYWGPPMRTFVPPEITSIRLKRA